MDTGGHNFMIPASRPARQPHREVLSMEHLIHERAIALANDIIKTTLGNYGSALNSYLSFTTSHNLPAEPTINTLSFYIVYMSFYVNPCTVNTYLTGISQQIEPYFPSIREIKNSSTVKRTLRGCMCVRGVPVI
jgi:hypothetical protein